MKNIIGFAIAILFFSSCAEKAGEKTDKVYKSYIQGLASPVQLKLDSTEVLLTDYFPDAAGIEKVTLDGKEISFNIVNGTALIIKNPASAIGNLVVMYKGVKHDIPVFASEKVRHHFSYQPSTPAVASVEMSGSMNGWNHKATVLRKEGGEWVTDLVLNKGLYQYRIWEDGKEMMDANNPEKMDNGMGAFNNTFAAGKEEGRIPYLRSLTVEDGKIVLISGDEGLKIRAYFENSLIDSVMMNGFKDADPQYRVSIPMEAKLIPRTHIRIFADNGMHRSNDILIPLEFGVPVTDAAMLKRNDMNAAVMYFAMVDRFVDGDTTNDRPTNDPDILPQANNLGGDLAGITQKINDGDFSKLGINTIWISPITTNAEGAWGLWDKGVKSKFSAYHGYWPTGLRSIDNRFGTEAQLKELIDVAHKNDMNVILDYVAHHVHQDHPLYKQKPDWTTPLYLPDGTMNTEKWDEHRLTTWFDTFLPTWNFANHEVVEALTDTAMYWVEHYDLDGFRHDATKHITEDFWRTLTRKVKNYKSEHPGRNIYQVGETYGNPELISSYINSGELDAQFDFNLYDAAVDAFAKDNTNFENLERVMKESMHYYGSHHVMGSITGNQDRVRFISYADSSIQFSEDGKLAGWTRKIENKNKKGFEKLAMLNAFLMTTPGIPCIYYGDEIGLPGGNDPDNRRMMHFNDLTPDQQQLHDLTAQLIQLRNENMALTYGDLFILKNDAQALVFVRSYFGRNIIVVFDKHENAQEGWTLQIPEAFNVAAPKVITNGNDRYKMISGELIAPDDKNDSADHFAVFY